MIARIHASNGDKRKPRTAVSDLYTLLGYARAESRDRASALTAFRAGEIFDPENGNISMALGRWFYEDQDWRTAISYFEHVHAVNSRIPVAYIMEGHCYGFLKEWKQACAAYQSAIRLQPWDGTVYLSLAGAQEKMGDPAAAIATLQSALTREVTHEEDIRHSLAALSPQKK